MIKNLLCSSDTANLKLAAILATPEEFREAVLSVCNLDEDSWSGNLKWQTGLRLSRSSVRFTVLGKAGPPYILYCGFWHSEIKPLVSTIVEVEFNDLRTTLKTVDRALTDFCIQLQSFLENKL